MPVVLGQLPRLLRFALVGALCFGLQGVVLLSLERIGAAPPVANAAGFVLSAQVNFILSTVVTWSDHPAGGAAPMFARWVAYQATAAFSLLINTVAFTATHAALGSLPAAAAGVVAGTAATFLVCHLLVFRVGRGRRPARASFPRRFGRQVRRETVREGASI
jgi:putative flippase GtrA